PVANRLEDLVKTSGWEIVKIFKADRKIFVEPNDLEFLNLLPAQRSSINEKRIVRLVWHHNVLHQSPEGNGGHNPRGSAGLQGPGCVVCSSKLAIQYFL